MCFFKLPLGYLLCCKVVVGELTYGHIKVLKLADDVEWPKPKGGAKDPQVAVCACFCVSVWGHAHKPSKKKKRKKWGQRGQEALQNDPRWAGCYSDKTHAHLHPNPVCQYGEFIRGMDLLHKKDQSNYQIYQLPQFRASGMYVQPNALIEWDNKKDLGRLMVVVVGRGLKQKRQGRRHGWLVSESEPSGHLSAGTDDTATARQVAIIASLVAEHWANPSLRGRNRDVLLTAHTDTRHYMLWVGSYRVLSGTCAHKSVF